MSIPARCIMPVVCRSAQDSLMRAGIRLFQPARTAASGSFVLHSLVPIKPRMSATAAEPAAAAPEPQAGAAEAKAAPEAPVASASAPDTAKESATPFPDATSDPVVAGVLKRFIQQYETKDTTEQDGIIDESYRRDAVFDDNLFHVTGTPNIKVQFHAVAKLFKTCKISIQSSTVEAIDAKRAATVPGGRVIKVFNIQDYTVASKDIKIECDTTITIDAEGKITDHMDKWRSRWANFGFLKRIGGSATSALMKAVKY